ncbi:MAG TPA: hypothetical protein VEH62_12490 [Gemmatimonadales bacterium]|nr:hypothetical protein [Gemmatimonadales bacterium]
MIALLVAGCGKKPQPTTPEDPFATIGVAPLPVEALAGSSVLLLPVGATVLSDSAAVDAGLLARRFALAAVAGASLDSALRRGAPAVKWIGLAEQRRALRMAPALGIDPARLETDYLLNPRVESLADPLWAQLRTLIALTDAHTAVAPAGVRLDRRASSYVAEYVLVLVDVRQGKVLGRARMPGAPADTPEAALANAAAATVPPPPVR